MRCNNCGTENNNGVKYCTSCGEKLKKKNKRIFWVLISTVIVLIAIITVIVVINLSGRTHPNTVEIDPLKDNYTPVSSSVNFDEENNIYYAEDEIIIIVDSDTSDLEISSLLDKIGGTRVGTIPSMDMYQIKLNKSYTLSELITLTDGLTKEHDYIQFATYDSAIIGAENVVEGIAPNDPWEKDVDESDWKDTDIDGTNWWLEAIDAPKAWSYNDQMEEINIGVSDSSFDVGHEDLKNKCSFPNEILERRNEAILWWLDNNKKTNNRDDQRNAHGTHVAGIIGAEHNNGKGISGTDDKCHLFFAPQYENEDADDFLTWDSSIFANLSYLVDAGCKIINYSQGKSSWIESSYSNDFINREGNLAAISVSKLLEKGNDFIVVQSAGNGDKNGVAVDAINNGWFCSISDKSLTGSQQISIQDVRNHIIIVGAAKQEDNNFIISDYSNFGNQVSIFAPGDDIYSTLPGDVFGDFEIGGGYGKHEGTSMAAPIVSGVCGLTWSANSDLTAAQVKGIICSNDNTTIEIGRNLENPNFTSARMINALLSVESALKGKSSSSSNSKGGFKSGKYLVNLENKIIGARSDGIYYKENVTSEAKKISNTGNVISLLSDGETVYYAEGYDDYTDIDKRFTSKKIYKTSISDSKSEYIFSSNGQADLITCQNGCLYYLDIIKSGNDYKYSLMKHKIGSSDSTKLVDEWAADLPAYWKDTAYCLGNTIFLTVNDSLCSYSIDNDKYKELISASDGSICDIIDNKVCFRYSKGESYYIAMIDANSNVETSVPISKKYDYQIVAQSGEYALFSSTMGSGEYNLYTINLKTGKIDVSVGDAGGFLGKNYFVAHDLVKPENLYFMYGVRLYDENSKSLKQMKSDEFEINITKPMWIIDSYIVDWDMNTYKIYDGTVDSSNTNKTNLSHDESWKTLYIDHINSMNEVYEDIYIAYIDDDDIPELYVRGKYHLAGAALCWIDDGEVKFQACAQNFGFKEKSGKCYAYTMHMGVSLLTEYTLSDGKLTEKKIASCSENNDTYTWDGSAVSKDDFWYKHQSYINNYTTPNYTEYTSREDFATTIESY